MTDEYDEDAHMAGPYSAWSRSESRYGRRHHDHPADRWARWENRQDHD